MRTSTDFRIARFACFALAVALLAPAVPSIGDVILPPYPGEVSGSPFLLRETGVRAVVTGPVAHVVVTQRWENPNAEPVDGLYIFPLPENAAVTDMSLKIGDRLIRADMKRREEAREIYEQARAAGKVAGLLDQERPNIFAQRVANIMPGAKVEVILEFDQEIPCEDTECEYVFPTVVGPRFIPSHQSDPGEISPPVVPPEGSTGQRFTLTLDLDQGTTLRDLRSPSHRVSVELEDDTRARVALAADLAGALNRDFRLRWRVGSETPEAGLLSWRDPQEVDDHGVFTLILQPPAADFVPAKDDYAAPREIVFVLDCSGSMSGVPITAARNVVRKTLEMLRPNDTFQIIRFSEAASGLGPQPLTPTRENLRRALDYLDSLRGQGGTHMIAGIRAALTPPPDPERLRIVAFLTDGYIGNEREILAEVQRLLGSARLFSFGIGSSVNRYLLEGLAEEGRGASAFLGPRETPDEMVERFVRRIATPVLTDIRITWENLEVEDLEPSVVPDLFAGQPLVIHGRYRKPGTGLVLVEGRRGEVIETFRRVVTLRETAADNEALGRLWARARIHRLNRELHGGENEKVKETIIGLALRHRLMTAWTSLVAVDSVVSNTSGSSTPITVPIEMPQDVSYEGVFGGRVARHRSGYAGASKMSAQIPMNAPTVAIQEREPAKQAIAAPKSDAIQFTRLVLVMPDGGEIRIEADGEVWWIDGRRRRLERALTASQMETLQGALRKADPQSWAGRSTGPRLVLEDAGGTRTVQLPSGDAAIARLADLIRDFAS